MCTDFRSPTEVTINSQAEMSSVNFNFDRIFGINSTQEEVYEFSGKPLLESIFKGFNATILAYGQTSSGKTHTMQGDLGDPFYEGITPRIVKNIFSLVAESPKHIEFTIKVSAFEIYKEKLRDLVENTGVNLTLREDREKGFFVEDLAESYVGSEEEVLNLMKIASENRAIGSTSMNDVSSRSHSVFVITLHQCTLRGDDAKVGKLYLVDLAGSEKIKKTETTGQLMEEGILINQSLSTLGRVIHSLTDGKSSFIPYRDSILTKVLQESLGGNSKTSLIITCSPSSYNEQETLSTLRFGTRAKKIKNKPKVNKELTIGELKSELEKSRKEVSILQNKIVNLEKFIRKNGLEAPKDLIEDINLLMTKLAKDQEANDERNREDFENYLKKKLSGIKDEHGEKEEDDSEFKSKYEEEKALNAKVLQQLDEAMNFIKESNITIAAKEREIDELKYQNKELSKKGSDFIGEFKKMGNTYLAEKKQKESSSDKIQEYEQEIAGLRKEKEELVAKVKVLDSDNNVSNMVNRNKSLQEQCAKYMKFYEDISSKNSALKIENSLFRNRLKKKEEKEKRLLDQLEAEQERIRKLSENIHSVQNTPTRNVVKVLRGKTQVSDMNL